MVGIYPFKLVSSQDEEYTKLPAKNK